MRIVVLDGHTLNPGDNPWEGLAALGDLTVYDRSREDEIVARADGAEIVLTNKTPLSADVIARLPSLRFIAVLATGYNIVDVGAARARGVVVSNVPEYGTDSVAQHVLALLLELTNAVGEHDRLVKQGEWARAPDFSFWRTAPVELAERCMGIVGFGRIGRRVADLAHALGMSVIATGRPGGARPAAPPWSPFAWRDLDVLFAESDVVSLHCPLTPESKDMVNGERLARMRPTAYLINTARGGLVDEKALAEALRHGRIAGAALDVVSQEPVLPTNPLLGAPRCILTPHLAWASLSARQRLMSTSVENVRAFLAGHPIHVVSA